MALTQNHKDLLGEIIAEIEAGLLTEEEIDDTIDELAAKWRVPADEIISFMNY